MKKKRIGIDIGGTFTDFVAYDPDSHRLETFKLLSTPHHPAEAVLQGLRRLGIADRSESGISQVEIIHGSTIATNALLERKGAVCALVTTRGFKDLLQIGRQNRPTLYDLNFIPAPVLIPAELRFEIDERVDHDGKVIQEVDLQQVKDLIPYMAEAGIEAVAVCTLFSFLYPSNEARVAECLSGQGWHVSLSSEILPEFREYERLSTTVVNAYVSPVLERYLGALEQFSQGEIRVMKSNGGSMRLEEARQKGVHCILSGPAGGVIGAMQVKTLSHPQQSLRLITFDMGGTSTDVSLVDGQPRLTYEATMNGCPIHIPLLDIHTIGAGGGSIACCDEGGALKVGPESAGAFPGPACYGRLMDPAFDVPTVTDANLVLGRLVPGLFLGGAMPLYPDRSLNALTRLGNQLGLDPYTLALGIIEVACAHMERAIRLISVERGYDTREFTLLSFGGAGGLHAVDLARRCGIPQVVVPPNASTLSALGMLAADLVKDYSQTVMLSSAEGYRALELRLQPMLERGRQELLAESVPCEKIRLEPALDMRLRGQSYELTVPFQVDYLQRFHQIHDRLYGYSRPEAEVEVVTLRVRAVGEVDPPVFPDLPLEGEDPCAASLDFQRVGMDVDGRFTWQKIPFYRFELLRPGNRVSGPAVIARHDTTVWLGTGDQGRLDGFGNLWIALQGERVDPWK